MFQIRWRDVNLDNLQHLFELDKSPSFTDNKYAHLSFNSLLDSVCNLGIEGSMTTDIGSALITISQ